MGNDTRADEMLLAVRCPLLRHDLGVAALERAAAHAILTHLELVLQTLLFALQHPMHAPREGLTAAEATLEGRKRTLDANVIHVVLQVLM